MPVIPTLRASPCTSTQFRTMNISFNSCNSGFGKKFRSLPGVRGSKPAPRLSSAFIPRATGGGNDGGNSGGSGGSGGGGNGGSGDNKGDDKEFFLLKGWRERVAADPLYPRKVAIEQIIGVGFSVIGDMASRPNFGLNELDFVLSTLIVGSVLNFTLMWLLAPTVGSAAATSLFQRAMSGELLASWGCPAGHMFQTGGYSLGQRAGTFLYKGVQFGIIGVIAGLIGTSFTNGLLEARKKLNPGYVSTVEPPNIPLNALTWGAHMAFSSNVRYQTLNMVDMAVAKVLSPNVFVIYNTFIRAVNNIAGGASFCFLAKLFGVQKSADPAPAPAPVPAAQDKKKDDKKKK